MTQRYTMSPLLPKHPGHPSSDQHSKVCAFDAEACVNMHEVFGGTTQGKFLDICRYCSIHERVLYARFDLAQVLLSAAVQKSS
jgi:hypothetical protein